MKIVIIGGGVVGTAAAYYLAGDGHQVTVLETHGELATEASGGNACLVAPGHSFAWASPAAPRMMLSSLRGAETAIRVKPALDFDLVKWGLRFLRECTSARARRNTLNKLRLCRFSRDELEAVIEKEAIDLDHVERGLFYLFRDAAELNAGAEKMRMIQAEGERQDVVDAAGCCEIEPALADAKAGFAGAVYGRDDFTGDCRKFTEQLALRCRGLGVDFEVGTAVHGLDVVGGRVVGAITDGRVIEADAFVVAAGVHSPRLSRSVGERLPVYPAKGYSATFPISAGNTPPAKGGVDERTLVAWSNLGDRFRMSSTAEFSGYGRGWSPADFNNIRRTAEEIFPGAAEYDRGEYRACLRPMTPDGPPVIGRSRRCGNLWYDTGHGHLGWTMACGSGKLLAALIGERRPEIPLDGLEVRG